MIVKYFIEFKFENGKQKLKNKVRKINMLKESGIFARRHLVIGR